jgi:hypothetical protein
MTGRVTFQKNQNETVAWTLAAGVGWALLGATLSSAIVESVTGGRTSESRWRLPDPQTAQGKNSE